LGNLNYRIRLSVACAAIFVTVLSLPIYSKSPIPDKSLHSAIAPRKLAVKPPQTNINSDAQVDFVVVKFKDEHKVRLIGSTFFSKSGASLREANTAMESLAPNRVRRLFSSQTEKSLDLNKEVLSAKSKTELADLNGYFKIDVTSTAEAQQLINQFNSMEIVEIAYFQPKPEPAGFFEEATAPNFQPNQDYREAAPAGVDADYANLLAGGDGSGIKIIDIEGAWRHSHIDLTAAAGSHIAGNMINDLSWRNHGTAVLGEMIANDDGQGVVGICPGADVGTVSIGSLATSEALLIAADNLQPGDAILIELHAPGPHFNFQTRPDQLGYVCMEYWQDNFDAIQYCWARGITVIEAAGNGAENFDNATYYQDLFDTTYRNSHAIIAGAGHPPVDFENLQRESFSNYGERVNLQGYGSNVYSTGYGDLYGNIEDSFYTAGFSGTSSASPIITGTVACLQGRYKELYGTTLNSDLVRSILVATGTPQQGVVSQHIGPRPDLEAAFAILTPPPSIYAEPIYLDTTLDEGTTGEFDIWLHNRNLSVAMDFSINDNDSLTKLIEEDWLQASPLVGTIPPEDSAKIDVTMDASLVGDRIAKYKGVLEINWGPSGGSLDSLTLVPAFLEVPCFDTTYTSKASDDAGGPVYSWISARTLGTKLTNTSFHNTAPNPLDDGTSGPHPIGFDFPFFDSSYSQVHIGVNGAISFTDVDVNFGGYFGVLTIPTTEFQTLVTAFWNDLIFDTGIVPASGIYIYRNAANDTMVIEWYKPGNFNLANDTTTDFEIIFTADGNIQFQYLEVGNGSLNQFAVIGVTEIECAAKDHYSNGNPVANLVNDMQAVQFVSNIWDYVWAGDCHRDGVVNILDLNFTVNYIFRNGPAPVPFVIGDVNCDGTPMQILDLNYLVNRIFRSGPPTCQFILRN